MEVGWAIWCYGGERLANVAAETLVLERLLGRKLLDKYEVIRLIGHGGMGSVYEAIDIPSGHHVALKWMHAQEFGPNDPGLIRFTQEARIAGKLDSPHVVMVYELARDPESHVPFHVMELLEGESVSAAIARLGALDPDIAARIAVQACAGLAAAHAAGVVHRDVKPDNLFLARVDDELIVKVLDFGIAKIRESGPMAGNLTVPANPMTHTGQVLGTPLFMAPEQIGGAKHADARCDVYAMGVTLFAMLAGAPPHANIKSFAELLHTLSTAPTMPLRLMAPWVPEQLAAIVDKARSLELKDRYADAAALHAALLEVVPEGTKLRPDMLVSVASELRRDFPIDPQAAAKFKTTVHSTKLQETLAQTLVAPNPAPAGASRKALIICVMLVLVAVVAILLQR